MVMYIYVICICIICIYTNSPMLASVCLQDSGARAIWTVSNLIDEAERGEKREREEV